MEALLEPSEQEQRCYYTGLPSSPRLVARSGTEPWTPRKDEWSCLVHPDALVATTTTFTIGSIEKSNNSDDEPRAGWLVAHVWLANHNGFVVYVFSNCCFPLLLLYSHTQTRIFVFIRNKARERENHDIESNGF